MEEDGSKWLREPKLCRKSCRAVLKRRSRRKVEKDVEEEEAEAEEVEVEEIEEEDVEEEEIEEEELEKE